MLLLNKPILIVGDESADTLLMLQNIVLDHALLYCPSGYDALGLLHRRGRYKTLKDAVHPRAMLVDLDLPDMDGYQMVRVLKHDVHLRSIPVFFMLAPQHADELPATAQAGVVGYLRKPIEFSHFLNMLQRIEDLYTEMTQQP